MNVGSERVIKALVLDIDGVLTDGTVMVGGPSQKRIFFRADGDRLAKQASHVALEACGGRGAVSEAVDLILERCAMKAD